MAGLIATNVIHGFIVLSFIGYILSEPFHEQLTPEERSLFFPNVGTDEVPDYEIIPIHKSAIQKRAIGRSQHLHIKAFDENIQLWLHPMDGVLAAEDVPIITMRRPNGILLRREWPNLMSEALSEMFRNWSSAATVNIIKEASGNYQVNGILQGQGIQLRSIPNQYRERARRSIDNSTESDHEITYHIASKLPKPSTHLQHQAIENPLYNNSTRSRRQAGYVTIPEIIYPEIMVIIDYPLFKLMNEDRKRAVQYALAFFNSVDLKYRTLESPKYRLNIAGIIIAADPWALSYMNLYTNDGRTLNVNAALLKNNEFLGYLAHNLELNFDLAITLTPTNFCGADSISNECFKHDVNGYAWIKLSCQIYKINDSIYAKQSGGIVSDQFGFQGIHVAAHEIGHLLGINHDSPEFNECSEHGGTIMTPNENLEKGGEDWSKCSLRQLQQFLETNPSCLFNKPSGRMVPTFLPGRLLSANEQCQKTFGHNYVAHTIDDRICYKLVCINRYNRHWTARHAAADGTECGTQKMCLHGHCKHISSIQQRYY